MNKSFQFRQRAVSIGDGQTSPEGTILLTVVGNEVNTKPSFQQKLPETGQIGRFDQTML